MSLIWKSNITGFNNVTVTNFIGDGANLTNTGATLFPSGTNGDTQKVVLTHLTSGTMTYCTTDADLTFTCSYKYFILSKLQW